jgi:5-methylcytosine-specific restriction enzyme subunit McrC
VKKITFYEYSGFLDGSDKIIDSISLLPLNEKQIERLKSLSVDNITGKEIFTFKNNSIKANSIVGVIAFDNVQIEILPKLLKSNENDSKYSIMQNLMFMLSYTNQIEINNVGLGMLGKENDGFIEAYISIFADTLFRRLRKFGATKKYMNFSENLNFVRGRIDFSRNVLNSAFNQSKVFCDFSDLTENNPINNAFKYVATSLSKLTQNQNNYNTLVKCIGLLDGIETRYVNSDELSKQSVPMRDTNFVALINLTKMFLNHLRPSFANKRDNNVFVLLFDMNSLFEEFIFKLLKRNEARFDIKVTFQKGKRLVTAVREFDDSSAWDNKSLFNTFTDIVIETRDKRKLIIDTKYKLIEDGKSHFGISNPDVFQVLTYKTLHNTFNQPASVALLYPENKNRIQKEFRVNSEDFNSFIAFTVNLSIDMKKSINLLEEELGKLILNSQKIENKAVAE